MKTKIKTPIRSKVYVGLNNDIKKTKRSDLPIYLVVWIIALILITLIVRFNNDAVDIDIQLLEQRTKELRQDQAEILAIFNVDLSKDKSDTAGLSNEEHIWYILADEYGFTFSERIQAMGILQCESLNEQEPSFAIGVNKNGSLDLGIWQVNEPSHGDKEEYSRACMFDVYCQTRFIIENIYIPQGRSWNAWSC